MKKESPFPRRDLAQVLDYLWQDEEADYLARGQLEDCAASHIFTSLARLRAWLEHHTTEPTGNATARPEQALRSIFELMDARPWTPDTLDAIAAVLGEAGLTPREP